MRLTTQQWSILAAIVFLLLSGILTYNLLESNKRTKALEAAVKVYEKDLTALREKNFILIDSLEQIRQVTDERISNRDKKIEDLLIVLDSILNQDTDEEDIDRINDPYSIAELFARYYPDHNRSGEGSDKD